MTPDQLPTDEFIEEAGDLLQELESALLQLETTPQNSQLIDQVFRCVHTIKGGAGMVMQPELADYAHQLESLLERVRSGILPCTVELVSLLLESLDCLNSFVAFVRGEGEVNVNLRAQTLERLKAFVSVGYPRRLTIYEVSSVQIEDFIHKYRFVIFSTPPGL